MKLKFKNPNQWQMDTMRKHDRVSQMTSYGSGSFDLFVEVIWIDISIGI